MHQHVTTLVAARDKNVVFHVIGRTLLRCRNCYTFNSRRPMRHKTSVIVLKLLEHDYFLHRIWFGVFDSARIAIDVLGFNTYAGAGVSDIAFA
jgi:hypothetical protein